MTQIVIYFTINVVYCSHSLNEISYSPPIIYIYGALPFYLHDKT